MSDVKMLILQGISGSGKSTYAKELAAQDPDWRIVSRDAIREQIVGGKEQLSKYFEQGLDGWGIEREVTKREHLAIATALAAGKKVIIDNTDLNKEYVVAFCGILTDIFPLDDANNIELKRLDVSLEEAKERIKSRGAPFVSDSVLQNQYKRLQSCTWTIGDCYDEMLRLDTRTWFLPPFEVEPYQPDKTKPKAVLCDLDGTLAHRALLKTPKFHYRSFFSSAECITDEPDALVAYVMRGLAAQGIEPIFVSGRKEDAREQSEAFIRGVFGPDFKFTLLMRDPKIDRNEKNHDAGDDVVKYRLFNEYIRENYDVIGAIDDRKRVVALWEALGLKVLNVGSLNEVF